MGTLRQLPPTPPAGGNYPYQAMPPPPPPRQYRVVERIPFSNQTNVQSTKRPASRDGNPESPKKQKLGTYECQNISPVGDQEPLENIPPEIFDDFFYTPLN